MMDNKKYNIKSIPQNLFNNKYLVKTSILEIAKGEISVLVSVFDVINKEFSIKFFSKEDAAVSYISLLKAASI
ncbi:hypothetical protein [Synechococcus phage BUCT-ZZ01]|nr:hypothetical protein [Synechococcus phage BUCT-ZZ01]